MIDVPKAVAMPRWPEYNRDLNKTSLDVNYVQYLYSIVMKYFGKKSNLQFSHLPQM